MVKETNKVRSKKSQSIFQLLLIIGLVVLLNLVLNPYFFRIDLTKEQIIYLRAAQQAGAFCCIALGHKAAIQAFNDWQKMLDK